MSPEAGLISQLDQCLHTPTEVAWDRFIREIRPTLIASVRRVLARTEPATIEDLAQQALVRLVADDCAALRRFSGIHDRQLVGYLRVIATNIALDHLRQNRPVAPLDPNEPAPDTGQVFQRLLRRDIERHLAECAKKNPGRDLKVFWLYYQSGWPAERIAADEEFGLGIKGVESLLRRLTRCIRAAILPGLAEGKLASRTSLEEGS